LSCKLLEAIRNIGFQRLLQLICNALGGRRIVAARTSATVQSYRIHSGDYVTSGPILAGVLLMALARPAAAQRAAISPDSARSQIRAVLRAFYRNLEHQNW
jgi:hypothetical protein